MRKNGGLGGEAKKSRHSPGGTMFKEDAPLSTGKGSSHVLGRKGRKTKGKEAQDSRPQLFQGSHAKMDSQTLPASPCGATVISL